MDIYIDDYVNQLQTSVSMQYKPRGSVPSGRAYQQCAEPVNTPAHAHTFTLHDKAFVLTLPMPQVKITREVDSALWQSLEASAQLIARGRLTT